MGNLLCVQLSEMRSPGGVNILSLSDQSYENRESDINHNLSENHDLG